VSANFAKPDLAARHAGGFTSLGWGRRLRDAGLLLLVGVAAPWATGCRKPAPPPAPPRIKTELVQSLFRGLDQHDYDLVEPKLARLREIHPESVYLAELERAVVGNRITRRIQEKVDADDPAGAMAVVAEALVAQGRHEDLLAQQATVASLVELRGLVDTCLAPPNAVALARAAARLKTLAATDARLASILPSANTQLIRARDLLAWERQRAIDDLCSDLDLMIDRGDNDAFAVLAVLAVADPGNPVLADWLDFFAGRTARLPRTYSMKENPAP
jgi:hypothetical protein